MHILPAPYSNRSIEKPLTSSSTPCMAKAYFLALQDWLIKDSDHADQPHGLRYGLRSSATFTSFEQPYPPDVLIVPHNVVSSCVPKILLLGAAGYIAGTILTELLDVYPASNITVSIRKEAQRDLFKPLGVNIAVGDYSDVRYLSKLASENDIVINYAVAFGGDEPAIQAIVEALEERAQHAVVKPVYIHSGGTGTVMYGLNGEAGTDTWTDEDYERWNSLPDSAFFYKGYKIVAAAALRGTISAYISLSPTIYGPGTGPGNKLSLQIPAYVKYAKQNGQAAYIGKGENIWGNVHVKDVARLNVAIVQHALAHPTSSRASAASYGWENLIYTGVDQHSWGPVVEELGNLLHARGDVKEAGAKSIPEGEGIMYMFGGNSFLQVSRKARSFGWKPQEKDLLSSMREALPAKE